MDLFLFNLSQIVNNWLTTLSKFIVHGGESKSYAYWSHFNWNTL